jgi:hypothetical protein
MAVSDTLSGRFYFRLRTDPGAANVLFAVIENGTFAQRIDLRLATVSSVRKLQLWSGGSAGSGGTNAMRADFGAITFGTASTNIYLCEWTCTKGTTISNGTLKMKIWDSTHTLFGSEYTSTATDSGTVQYVRSHWGGNTGVPMDMDVWAILTDDNPVGYYPGVYVVPSNPPTITETDYNDYTVVVASSSPGSGGVVSHTATPTTGVIEPSDGVFLFPRQAATGANYTATVTVTESPSGQTAVDTATVPKMEAGGATNITAPRYPVGSVPGTTWS